MKVGLSYSRCVRDIVEGKVDFDDVLVIITRTDFDPHDPQQWKNIWTGYGGGGWKNIWTGYGGGGQYRGLWSNPEWAGYDDDKEDIFRTLTIDLLEAGKLHQPRQFGADPRRLPYYWLDVVLTPEDIEANDTVKKAWEQFQIVSGLLGLGVTKAPNS